VGYPATVLGVIGLFFTAAGMRSIIASESTRPHRRRQVGLFVLLVLIFGTELISGIAVIANPRQATWLQIIGYALVTSLIVGIERAWELVGDRETSLFASIAVLAGRTPSPDGAETSTSPRPEHGSEPASGPSAAQAGERGDSGGSGPP
jgi:hypothetical protein